MFLTIFQNYLIELHSRQPVKKCIGGATHRSAQQMNDIIGAAKVVLDASLPPLTVRRRYTESGLAKLDQYHLIPDGAEVAFKKDDTYYWGCLSKNRQFIGLDNPIVQSMDFSCSKYVGYYLHLPDPEYAMAVTNMVEACIGFKPNENWTNVAWSMFMRSGLIPDSKDEKMMNHCRSIYGDQDIGNMATTVLTIHP